MNGSSTISFLNTKDGSDRRLQIFIFLFFRQEKGRKVPGLVGAWMLVESLFENFLVRLGVRNGFLFIDWKSDGPTKKKGLESRCHESDNSFVKPFLTLDCLVLTFSTTHNYVREWEREREVIILDLFVITSYIWDEPK